MVKVKTKSTEEKWERYCSKCGSELLRVPIPAEKAKVVEYAWGDCTTFNLGSRYNKYSGKRQFGIVVMCPNSKWWNHCTNYVDEKSLHDSDLPELIKL